MISPLLYHGEINMEKQFVDLNRIREIFRSQGRDVESLTRNIRKEGFTLYTVKGLSGRARYTISKEDEEKFLKLYENSTVEITVPKKPQLKIEEQVRQRRTEEGWVSFRLSSAGMPDILNIKRKEDGSFELLFEEVKGRGDGVKREQHDTLEKMKQSGIPAVITWID